MRGARPTFCALLMMSAPRVMASGIFTGLFTVPSFWSTDQIIIFANTILKNNGAMVPADATISTQDTVPTNLRKIRWFVPEVAFHCDLRGAFFTLCREFPPRSNFSIDNNPAADTPFRLQILIFQKAEPLWSDAWATGHPESAALPAD